MSQKFIYLNSFVVSSVCVMPVTAISSYVVVHIHLKVPKSDFCAYCLRVRGCVFFILIFSYLEYVAAETVGIL